MKTSHAIISLSAIFAGLTLSAQESPRPAGGSLADRFKQLEKNGAVKFNAAEAGTLGFFKPADSNGDGSVTLGEAQTFAQRSSDQPDRKRTAGMEGDNAAAVFHWPVDPVVIAEVVTSASLGGGELLSDLDRYRLGAARETALKRQDARAMEKLAEISRRVGTSTVWSSEHNAESHKLLEQLEARLGMTPAQAVPPQLKPEDYPFAVARRELLNVRFAKADGVEANLQSLDVHAPAEARGYYRSRTARQPAPVAPPANVVSPERVNTPPGPAPAAPPVSASRVFTDLRFARDGQPGTKDDRGQWISGTETMRFLSHQSRLSVSTGVWMDTPYFPGKGDQPWTGPQILVKESAQAPWRVDKSFPLAIRVDAMISGTFNTAGFGCKLDPVTGARIPTSGRGTLLSRAAQIDDLDAGTWNGLHPPSVPPPRERAEPRREKANS